MKTKVYKVELVATIDAATTVYIEAKNASEAESLAKKSRDKRWDFLRARQYTDILIEEIKGFKKKRGVAEYTE